MRAAYWIKIRGSKSYGSFKSTSPSISVNKPNVGKGEIAMKVTLEIPDDYFELPELQATIALPARGVGNIITADVQNNIADLIERDMGIKLHISHDDIGVEE